jgi:hypothetical protein
MTIYLVSNFIILILKILNLHLNTLNFSSSGEVPEWQDEFEPRSGSINNRTIVPDSFMNRGAVP